MKNLKTKSIILSLIGALPLNACQLSRYSAEEVRTMKSAIKLCENSPLEKWEAYGGGNGTVSNPYLICTPDQFQDIRGDMMEKRFFRITQDLDFSDKTYYWGWRPTPLGVIDGGNHKLKNITIDYSHGMVGTGIYNRLVRDLNGNHDEIKNLIIENARIIGNGTSAPGGVLPAENNAGLISNVHVYGTVIVPSQGGQLRSTQGVGGLVGINEAQIENSSFEGKVVGDFNVGGIVGVNSGSIVNSSFSGSVEGTAGVGGLVGVQLQSGEIKQSTATASISGSRLFGDTIGLNCPSTDYDQCWH